jgi:hypothetical protein
MGARSFTNETKVGVNKRRRKARGMGDAHAGLSGRNDTAHWH